MGKVFICTRCNQEHPTKDDATKCVLFHWYKEGLIDVDIYTVPILTLEEKIDYEIEERETE